MTFDEIRQLQLANAEQIARNAEAITRNEEAIGQLTGSVTSLLRTTEAILALCSENYQSLNRLKAEISERLQQE